MQRVEDVLAGKLDVDTWAANAKQACDPKKVSWSAKRNTQYRTDEVVKATFIAAHAAIACAQKAVLASAEFPIQEIKDCLLKDYAKVLLHVSTPPEGFSNMSKLFRCYEPLSKFVFEYCELCDKLVKKAQQVWEDTTRKEQDKLPEVCVLLVEAFTASYRDVARKLGHVSNLSL